jgi:hypothetical protein
VGELVEKETVLRSTGVLFRKACIGVAPATFPVAVLTVMLKDDGTSVRGSGVTLPPPQLSRSEAVQRMARAEQNIFQRFLSCNA